MNLKAITRGFVTLFGVTIVVLVMAPSPVLSAASLTGYWKADDGGTYFVLQDSDNSVWWAGIGPDDGRTFTNVFQGKWQANNATEEPADRGSVRGEWADVPRGGSLSNGTLQLSLQFSGKLVKRGETGGFGASTWNRIQEMPDAPEAFTRAFASHNELTGVWRASTGGAHYVRQVGNKVWWLGLRPIEGGNLMGEVFRGTIQGNRITGRVAFPPWPMTMGESGTNGVHLEADQGPGSTVLRGVEPGYGAGKIWRKIGG